MKHDAIDTLLEALTVGGRLNPERSHALPEEQYKNRIVFRARPKGESMEGTKEIERLMRHELDNWLRWGKRRDWMPTSFKVPLGFLYKSTDVHEGSQLRRMMCDEIGAAGFERIVVSLPEKHRQAFVMYQIGRAAVSGQVKITKGYDDSARLLGVAKSKYYELVNEAHSIVLRQVKQHHAK